MEWVDTNIDSPPPPKKFPFVVCICAYDNCLFSPKFEDYIVKLGESDRRYSLALGLGPQTLLWIDANKANRPESVPMNLNYLEKCETRGVHFPHGFPYVGLRS